MLIPFSNYYLASGFNRDDTTHVDISPLTKPDTDGNYNPSDNLDDDRNRSIAEYHLNSTGEFGSSTQPELMQQQDDEYGSAAPTSNPLEFNWPLETNTSHSPWEVSEATTFAWSKTKRDVVHPEVLETTDDVELNRSTDILSTTTTTSAIKDADRTTYYDETTIKYFDEAATSPAQFDTTIDLSTVMAILVADNAHDGGIKLPVSNSFESNSSDKKSIEESRGNNVTIEAAGWPVKHAAIVEGDVILGGLMMVHSREDSIICGPIMPQGGIQALEAMLFTLDQIKAFQLLPNISLGAHILDDCDKDTYGLEVAVDFIKGKIHILFMPF